METKTMTVLLLAILAFALIIPSSLADNKKCRALALEGGGDHGAYEVGVLSAFINGLPAEEVKWDVVSGVSVGAINAGMISIYAPGDEVAMIAKLREFWLNITREKVFVEWPGGIVHGFISMTGIMDSSPLKKLMMDAGKGKTPLRMGSVAATNTDTGEFVRYTEQEFYTQGEEGLVEAILSSASIPIVFPHVWHDNHTNVDGGIMINLDVGGAVQRCREKGFKDQDIIVDIVMASGASIKEIHVTNEVTIQLMGRYHALGSYRRSIRDLIYVMEEYQLVNFRYILKPTKSFPDDIPINFDKKQIEEMIKMGEDDGYNAIKKGAVNREELLKELHRTRRALTPETTKKYVTARL